MKRREPRLELNTAGADILASNGVPPQKRAPAATVRPGATEPIPEQRWEAEGGYVATPPDTQPRPQASPDRNRMHIT
jgi:hypothetical protein